MSSIASNDSQTASFPAACRVGTDFLRSTRFRPTRPAQPKRRIIAERLARSHYENFSVASWFLPQQLRQHFFNVYAYCRISDDLGDEVGDAAASLELLDQWQEELACMLLRPATSSRYSLLWLRRCADSIFRNRLSWTCSQLSGRTRRVSRYPTFDDLLGYCRNSANPVGRLVLYVCGYRDTERQELSDFTCTALQLANFWQDVSVDYAKGRIYLPLERFAAFWRDRGRYCRATKFSRILRSDAV